MTTSFDELETFVPTRCDVSVCTLSTESGSS